MNKPTTKIILRRFNLLNWEKDILMEIEDLDILMDRELTDEDWLKNLADILFTLKTEWRKENG